MNEEYYIRWKSNVTGPYSADNIKVMLAEGRISKHHQVSVDRLGWTPLNEAEGFQPDCYIRASTHPGSESVAAAKSSTQVDGQADDISEDGSIRHRFQYKTQPRGSSQERWYYSENGETIGPVTMWELRQQVDTGVILKSCPICKEGEERWVKIGEAFPSFWHTGTKRYTDAINGNISDNDAEVVYAGFWLRFIASIIDGILLSIIVIFVVVVISFVVGYQMAISGADLMTIGSTGQLLGSALQVLICWAYFATSESSETQATPGKRAMGLYVADMKGNRISFAQATGRHFGKIISSLLLGIGYLMAGVTDKKQARHDLMAGTLVLRRI
jgi:uncharacterized RDD family membrane protein YckC